MACIHVGVLTGEVKSLYVCNCACVGLFNCNHTDTLHVSHLPSPVLSRGVSQHVYVCDCMLHLAVEKASPRQPRIATVTRLHHIAHRHSTENSHWHRVTCCKVCVGVCKWKRERLGDRGAARHEAERGEKLSSLLKSHLITVKACTYCMQENYNAKCEKLKKYSVVATVQTEWSSG